MGILQGIKDRRAREVKLAEEVLYLKAILVEFKKEHKEKLNETIRKAVKDVGHWKYMYETLADEKHQWSEDARALQDKIDLHEALQSNEKFLGLVRAVKHIANFKIPLTDYEMLKATSRR